MKLGFRELFVFVLLLGFLGGAYFLGFKRLQAQRAYYAADIEKKQQTLRALTESAATLTQLEEELAALQESVKVFERKLPREKEVDQILTDVWQLAEQNALRATSVKPLKTDKAGVANEQPIELAFDGEFYGFSRFLQALEASDRIIRITQLELRKITDSGKPMQAKLVLNIYFEADKSKSLAQTN
jgi:type IV pilus assembly protein PilO